ncbi:MAG: BTAD domain-containing putative transcriptional regulator [Anaerolineae bacterium]|jgi:DNA-binding SARP family transcriptional activator
MLELRFFGVGQASYAGRPLPGFPHQQPYLLIIYLLLNPEQVHSREQLAALFWGDYPTATSRKYLRNALWRARHLLESVGAPADTYLRVYDEGVGFGQVGPYTLDVEMFEQMTNRHRAVAGRDLLPDQAAELERAVQLYTGELLSDVYEDWCLYERERLNLIHLDALGKLVVFHELNGTYERGLEYARRILAYDDTREKVHRRMMRLYWLAGDRGAALAQYKLCAQILQDTLGVAPMAETRQLYEQMAHGDFVSPGRIMRQGSPAPVLLAGSTGPWLQMEQALLRVEELQHTIQQANTELGQLHRLLSQAIGESRMPR